MSSTGYKQELPPPGGYADIHFERIKPKPLVRNWVLAAVTVAGLVYGNYYYKHRLRYYGKMQVERLDHFIALEPLIWAERDRDFLRQLRFNREEEMNLMKNVPGWVVGTIWGTPVFKSYTNTGDLPPMSVDEFYAHRPFHEQGEYYFADTWI